LLRDVKEAKEVQTIEDKRPAETPALLFSDEF